MFTGLREEKKVEYLELIYDLIFVYIVGRNNTMLEGVENGFVPWTTFAAYVLSALAVIQIWNFSTFYMNRFGRNGVRDHVFIIINMYLLYYIGQGTRVNWASFHTKYHVAWALILINIGVQYILEMRNQKGDPDLEIAIRNMVIVLFGEAALVLLAIPFETTQFPIFTMLAIVFGFVMVWLLPTPEDANIVDFRHLSERAMLYVVFSFGEMIIALASYFAGKLTFSTVYFSMMGFLIVVALFLSYEMFYDHILDRVKPTSGRVYMLIHVFLIFGMNNLTNALEFMRREEVSVLPKTIFLVSAFLLYYFCLFALLKYAKRQMQLCRGLVVSVVLAAVIFTAAMLLFREQMAVNIAISVAFAYAMFLRIFLLSRNRERNL